MFQYLKDLNRQCARDVLQRFFTLNSFDEQAFQRPRYLGRVVLGELIFYGYQNLSTSPVWFDTMLHRFGHVIRSERFNH